MTSLPVTNKNDEDIDVFYVITPRGTHHEFVLRAFAAGKQVVCDKPMASYPKFVQEMVDAGKRAGKRTGIGYRCHVLMVNLETMRLCRTVADPIKVCKTRDKIDAPRFDQVEKVNNFNFNFNFIFPDGIQGNGATAYSWNANNWRAMGTTGALNAEPTSGHDGNKILCISALPNRGGDPIVSWQYAAVSEFQPRGADQRSPRSTRPLRGKPDNPK